MQRNPCRLVFFSVFYTKIDIGLGLDFFCKGRFVLPLDNLIVIIRLRSINCYFIRLYKNRIICNIYSVEIECVCVNKAIERNKWH